MASGEPILYSLRYKAFKLIGMHPICAALFTAGYALREWGSYNYLHSFTTKTPLMVFVFSQVFIYVCPPLLELANYHILGRIFYYVPHCAPLPPGRVLVMFGALMAVVEVLNCLGVALAANPYSTPKKQELGSNLTLAAVGIQVSLIVIFICLAAFFHRGCSKAKVHNRSVTTMLVTLYMSMSLIFARCIYRLVEHTGGTKVDLDSMEALRSLSPILRYEVYFYVFEATIMLINSLLWNVWHPGRFLPKGYHIFLAPDGTEVEGEKMVDTRPLWAKIANVLTFGIFFRHKKQTPLHLQELKRNSSGDSVIPTARTLLALCHRLSRRAKIVSGADKTYHFGTMELC